MGKIRKIIEIYGIVQGFFLDPMYSYGNSQRVFQRAFLEAPMETNWTNARFRCLLNKSSLPTLQLVAADLFHEYEHGKQHFPFGSFFGE